MRATIWDLPTRLFHWGLVISITGSIVTINLDKVELHAKFAFASCTLVLFRLIWGFVGSETARFASFVRGPGAVLAYLRGEWRGAGHNPLGALSVLALLAVVSAQIATGLFIEDDDFFFYAPWSSEVTDATSRAMNARHEILEKVLYVLIALHLGAILFYRLFKKTDLVTPMITGTGEVPDRAPKTTGLWVVAPVLAAAVFLAGIVFRYWVS